MFPRKNRLVVLTYHRVLSRPEVASTADIDAEQFDMHVKTLDRYFNVLSLRDAVSLLDQRRLPARSVCITFDDGYKDNVTRALPILERHGVPATFFIATGYLDGGVMWNDVIIEAAKQSPRADVDLEELGFGHHALTSDTERQQLIAALLPEIKYLDTKTRDTLAAGIAERLEFAPPTDLMMASDDLQVLHRAEWRWVGIRSDIPSWPQWTTKSLDVKSSTASGTSKHCSALPLHRLHIPTAAPEQTTTLDMRSWSARQVLSVPLRRRPDR